jgi:hypothetical protein
MVDGETSVMMMVMIRQGAKMEFLVPNYGFWRWRYIRPISGKNTEPLMFLGQKAYVGGRRGRDDGRGGLTTPWRGLACATRGHEPLVAPLRLVFWLHVSSGKIGILQYFLGFFPKVRFLHKNKTPGQFC